MILDVAIIAVIGLFIWRGMRRGLIATLTGYVGFVVAVLAAVFGYGIVAAPLRGLGLSDGVANLAGALIVFVAMIAGATILGRTVTRALRFTMWGKLNTAAGGALSGAWALTIVTVVLLAISVIPLSGAMARQVEDSAIADAIVTEAPAWMDTIARTDLRGMLRLFTPEQRPVAIVATDDFQPAPAAERALFDLLNAERRARDVPPLAWNAGLARAARLHASDMYRWGFFGHASPARGSTADRYLLVGVPYAKAGENLVMAPSVSTAHALLMGSARHRAHILDGGYGRVGVGVAFGPQGLLVTQNFAD